MLSYSVPLEGSAAQCVEMSAHVEADDAFDDVTGCLYFSFGQYEVI